MSVGMDAPRLLDGKATARSIREGVAERCARLEQHGVTPGLSVVLVGEDPASTIYVRNKHKAAAEVGMRSWIEKLPATADEATVLRLVERLNRDPAVHGILVQLPLPSGVREPCVLESVDPAKDVDGFHPVNVGRLLAGLPGFVPCTPAGIVDLLRSHGIPLAGQHAVVIGRSNIVGKPTAVLLLREHCTVTVCHSRSRDVARLAAQADILVAAAGRRALVTGEYIRPGAVVVDVGIHRVEDEATCRQLYGDDPERLRAVRERGFTLAGDVHPLQARARAGWLSPVPGGVGPLTIARLLQNTAEAAERTLEARAAGG
jgi:methylenetetrahydrofolate dehydrogenase (NADP+)/methenyltetrahydrofolate cyclohydrolase